MFLPLLQGGKNGEMTDFFSVDFLAFFLPLALIIYWIVPKKAKKYALLVESLIFYWLVSGKLIVYILLTILFIHHFTMWIERIHKKRDEMLEGKERKEKKEIKAKYKKKTQYVLTLAIMIQLAMLVHFKYSAFFKTNINILFQTFNIPVELTVAHYIMPIGISFFSLQAISYLVDVYREQVEVDENLFRLALFMTFFPQIVEGPICRYKETAKQLWEAQPIKYENFVFGMQRILYGMMKKMIVANRLNPLIKEIFNNSHSYDGGVIFVGALCYTIQLYCDFSGSMDAVVGIGEILGIRMPENFKRPFFSKTISEFWQRWHITLGLFFRDYIFYPVTMSKPMKNLTKSARKKLGNHFGPLVAGSIALFAVWICNGLWHGSAWNYIFFGLYHFALILTGNIIGPFVSEFNTRFHINAQSKPYVLFQVIRSVLLVVIGELFFRARGFKAGAYMFTKIVTDFTTANFNHATLARLGIDHLDLLIVAIAVIVIFVISLINEKNICIRDTIASKGIVVKWAAIYALILFIVIFGAYGAGYLPVDPLYANF